MVLCVQIAGTTLMLELCVDRLGSTSQVNDVATHSNFNPYTCIHYTLHTGSIPFSIKVSENVSLNVVLDSVICRGGEKNLTECANEGIGMRTCGHSQIAAVQCEGNN